MFEFVIIMIIAVAVWYFVYFRKKQDESENGSSVGSVATPKVSPESEVKVAVKTEPEPIASEPEVVETIEVSEVAGFVPEDSALRRHYLQNLSIQVDLTVDEEPAEDIILQVENAPEAIIAEDVELKRDHIQQLVAEIEATMPPRPTDSTLKRHYDTQLMSSVLSQLQEQK